MHNHDHQQCIKTAIKDAEAICAQRGSRFTEIRRKVLTLVWQSHKAIKAYDILAALSDDNNKAKPPTVYRALDFLMAQGLVHKIESLNAYIGCLSPDIDHAGQFMICDSCENITEISCKALSAHFEETAKNEGFVINRQTVELHGLCKDCR